MNGSAPRRSPTALFLAAFAFFGLFAKGHVDNTDAVQSLYAARSLVLRGTLGIPLEPDQARLPGEEKILLPLRLQDGNPSGMVGRDGTFHLWFPVGHQLLMVVPAALGEGLSALVPAAETRSRAAIGRGWGDLFWAHLLASFQGALAAAGTCVVLFELCRVLGCTDREALFTTAATALCTQFWPMMTENLSDGPGLFFLAAATLQVVRFLLARHGPRTLLWAGTWAGCAVLLRYPHGLLVAVLGLFVAHTCWRQRQWRGLWQFAAGGVPWLLLLLACNALRFGEFFETGYGSAGLDKWFRYPFLVGLASILFAAGKGLLPLSPPLVLAFVCGSRRPFLDRVGWLLWLLFLVPVLLFSNTDGWQAGGCWGIRYVAPGAVLLVAAGLARGRPWRRWPRVTAAVLGLGFLAAGTGLLAPVRGHLQLAMHATRAHYAQQGLPLEEPDVPLHAFVDWRFSPLHSNWTYAWLSLSGRLERGGSANTTEPMFGVAVDEGATDLQPFRPSIPLDRNFRHLWWVHLGFLWGWWALPVGLAWLGFLGWAGARLRHLIATGSVQDPHGMGR